MKTVFISYSPITKQQAREIQSSKAKLANKGGKDRSKTPGRKPEFAGKFNPAKPIQYIPKEQWRNLSAEQQAAARKARAQKGIPTRRLKSLTRSEDEETPGEEAQDDRPPLLEPVPPKSPAPVPRKLGTAATVCPPHLLTAPSIKQ